MKTSQISDLNESNTTKIYDVLLKIDELRQLAPTPAIAIDLDYAVVTSKIVKYDYGSADELIKNRKQAIQFLRRTGLLFEAIFKDGRFRGKPVTKVIVTLANKGKFDRYLSEVATRYEKMLKRNREGSSSSLPKKTGTSALQLPVDTRWEDITIKFLNGHDVQIRVKDKVIQSDYKQMGFEDGRSDRPDQKWQLLEKLSQQHGELSWRFHPTKRHKDGLNAGSHYIKTADKEKKNKQVLSQKLKSYFQINEDPFHSYRKEGSYKIKLNLLPE